MSAYAISVASPHRQSQETTAHWRLLAWKSVSYPPDSRFGRMTLIRREGLVVSVSIAYLKWPIYRCQMRRVRP